ncbi:MAG: hypothetical protein ABWY01_03195 [Pseudoxanthomonas sp.]
MVCKILLAACSLCFFPAQAQASQDDGWQWMVAPYVWGVSLDTDLQRSEPPAGGIGSDINFDDVLDKFDGAFEVHVEGQGDHFGVLADFTYLGLADGQDRPRFRTETDLDARLFEIAGVWSPDDERYRGLDVFAGLRYIDLDLSVNFDPENPSFETTVFDGSQSYNDFMVGARYTWALSDRWGLTARGDGSFGDTEGTWNASAVATLRMKHGAWLFGYRYLAAELEIGDTSTDLTVSGPIIGYGFIF